MMLKPMAALPWYEIPPEHRTQCQVPAQSIPALEELANWVTPGDSNHACNGRAWTRRSTTPKLRGGGPLLQGRPFQLRLGFQTEGTNCLERLSKGCLGSPWSLEGHGLPWAGTFVAGRESVGSCPQRRNSAGHAIRARSSDSLWSGSKPSKWLESG
jgi:hypothetical protein